MQQGQNNPETKIASADDDGIYLETSMYEFDSVRCCKVWWYYMLALYQFAI